jgi:hypothetical protein
MTPKEKAEELLSKYLIYFPVFYTEKEYGYDEEKAKQCALIVVDEIQDFMIDSDDFNIYWVNYWREVKNEIEKL